MRPIRDMQETVFVAMARQIHNYVREAGAELDIPVGRLERQIRQYVRMRQRYHPIEISNPCHTQTMPEGWALEEEEIWQNWIHDILWDRPWARCVVEPLFVPKSQRVLADWEQQCPDWAEELETLLPTWIKRSWDLLDKYDPPPPAEDEDEVLGSVTSPIGKSKRKD
jgi:hypothetical protein